MLVFPQFTTGAGGAVSGYTHRGTRTLVNAERRKHGGSDGSGRASAAVGIACNWDDGGGVECDGGSVPGCVAGGWRRSRFWIRRGIYWRIARNSARFSGVNGPSIQLTAGVADPFGSTGAMGVVNTGAVAEAVAQTLAVPGNFQYLYSVWARAAGAAHVTLVASTTGGNAAGVFALSSQWKRLSLSVSLGQSTTSVTFGVQLDVSASVDLFGMQVEAQPGMSDYKKTGAGGVYSNARFAEDQLTVRAQATDVYDVVIRVVSRG